MSELSTAIAILVDRQLGDSEIGWRLGVAAATVRYHRGRLASGDAPEPPRTTKLDRSARLPKTRQRVAGLLAQGHSRAEIGRQLGLTKATVSYHARRLGEDLDGRCARRYDWRAVQAYHDAGNCKSDCRRRFGFTNQTWYSAIQRGDIVPRPHLIPIEQLLAPGKARNRQHIKSRLIAAGLKQPRCEECGLSHWRDFELSLSLHHVNGDRHDNRLENLELLCPNCHSQTDTFAGRNRPRGRMQGAAPRAPLDPNRGPPTRPRAPKRPCPR